MPPLIDLTGQRFGRLTALGRVPSRPGHTTWLWRCDCGREIAADAYNVKTGHTNSCGCLQRERARLANTTHGQRHTRLYRIWVCMRNRCYSRSYHAFKHYGGRGIAVCEEWRDSFLAFHDWAMANGYRDDLTIDRIDTDGDYSPDNCRWATMAEQNENKRVKNGYKIMEVSENG